MWKKEATSYYFFFVKLPWPKDHGQKLLSGSTIANEGMVVLVENYTQLKIPADSSAIITPLTILIMVSRRTLAELDVADPPENT